MHAPMNDINTNRIANYRCMNNVYFKVFVYIIINKYFDHVCKSFDYDHHNIMYIHNNIGILINKIIVIMMLFLTI